MKHVIGSAAVLFALSLIGGLGSRQATAGVEYYITEVGNFTVNDQFDQALGINDYGQVVGRSNNNDTSNEAWIWTPTQANGLTGNTLTNLGPQDTDTVAVNNFGQVIFNESDSSGEVGYLWTPTKKNKTTGTSEAYGNYGGPIYAYGLSDNGNIVGYAYPGVCYEWSPDSPNSTSGTLNNYINGGTTQPGFGDASYICNAVAINDAGQVAGSVEGSYSYPSIHIGDNGPYSLSDAIVPTDDGETWAGIIYSINASGHAAGTLIFPGTLQLNAFYYNGSTIKDLGFEAGDGPVAINKTNEIVTYDETHSYPALVVGNKETNVQTLIDPSSGWTITELSGINDSGQICGLGDIGGLERAFLLTPSIPTISAFSPSSIAAGGPAFTLTVTGTHFVSGAVVKWNSTSLATTFKSSTKLTATVPAADISTPGTASVTVTDPGTDGGTSKAKTFTIT